MSEGGGTATGQSDRDRPALRVVRGEPTAEELAALVAVLRSVAASQPTGGSRRDRSGWSDRASLLGVPACPGPGAWRDSVLPH